jgi:hypothetical protein
MIKRESFRISRRSFLFADTIMQFPKQMLSLLECSILFFSHSFIRWVPNDWVLILPNSISNSKHGMQFNLCSSEYVCGLCCSFDISSRCNRAWHFDFSFDNNWMIKYYFLLPSFYFQLPKYSFSLDWVNCSSWMEQQKNSKKSCSMLCAIENVLESVLCQIENYVRLTLIMRWTQIVLQFSAECQIVINEKLVPHFFIRSSYTKSYKWRWQKVFNAMRPYWVPQMIAVAWLFEQLMDMSIKYPILIWTTLSLTLSLTQNQNATHNLSFLCKYLHDIDSTLSRQQFLKVIVWLIIIIMRCLKGFLVHKFYCNLRAQKT